MLSPSVIGYFALSVVVGVWPGARRAPRPCAPLLCSLTRVPATGPGALLETALVVPQVRQALAHAASHGSEERIKLGVLASWGGGGPGALWATASPSPIPSSHSRTLLS